MGRTAQVGTFIKPPRELGKLLMQHLNVHFLLYYRSLLHPHLKFYTTIKSHPHNFTLQTNPQYKTELSTALGTCLHPRMQTKAFPTLSHFAINCIVLLGQLHLPAVNVDWPQWPAVHTPTKYTQYGHFTPNLNYSHTPKVAQAPNSTQHRDITTWAPLKQLVAPQKTSQSHHTPQQHNHSIVQAKIITPREQKQQHWYIMAY
jgi:hypothetical protein